MGEAGAEAIVPLTRMNNGDLGVKAMGGGNVTVNVINNSANSTATTSERSDGRGSRIIDVMIDQIKSSIAGDITRGDGAVPTAMAGTYGLNRVAGAY
jgi:phage-related minor tail protein